MPFSTGLLKGGTKGWELFFSSGAHNSLKIFLMWKMFKSLRLMNEDDQTNKKTPLIFIKRMYWIKEPLEIFKN